MDRISRDGCVAEIICDAMTVPPTWHCLIQQQGCAEVLFWSQESSRDDAVRAAEEGLLDLKEEARNHAVGQGASPVNKKFMTLREPRRNPRFPR